MIKVCRKNRNNRTEKNLSKREINTIRENNFLCLLKRSREVFIIIFSLKCKERSSTRYYIFVLL